MKDAEAKVKALIKNWIEHCELAGYYMPDCIDGLLNIVDEEDIISSGYIEHLNDYKKDYPEE